MAFWEFIQKRIHPEIEGNFEHIFREYKTAITTLISSSFLFSEYGTAFILEKSVQEKIVVPYKEIKDKLISLFNGQIPQIFSFKQKKFIVQNIDRISGIYSAYITERRLYDKVEAIKSNYPNAYREYCKRKNIRGSKLSHDTRITIISAKSELSQREPDLVAEIRHKDLENRFKKEVTSKYPRQFHYKKFYSDYASDNGMGYILNHLKELDAYCEYQDKVVRYKALDSFTEAFLRENNRKSDDYSFLFSSYGIKPEFKSFASNRINNEYDSLNSLYPLGIKAYRESISTRCLWPFVHLSVSPFIQVLSQPTKSRYELEQEYEEINAKSQKNAIELTLRYLCTTAIDKIIKLNRIYGKIEQIKKSYPKGYQLYISACPPSSNSSSSQSYIRVIMAGEPTHFNGKDYSGYYQVMIKNEDFIKSLNDNADWADTQKEFSNYVRSLRDELGLSWGCYYYDISRELKSSNYIWFSKKPEISFKVWQFFIESFSRADLDYTLCPRYSLDNIDNESLEQGNTTYKSVVYDRICKFISNIKFRDYTPIVVFADTDDRWEIYHKSSHFLYLRSILQEKGIPEHEYYSYIFNSSPKNIIVVVDLITSNSDLKRFASRFFSDDSEQPLMVYISLRKEYSEDEMRAIITSEQNKIDAKKAEIERQQKEIERKRQEEQRKYEDTKNLKSCVSSWKQPSRTCVACFSLYNYYPTTCGWEASEDEWDVRNTIWDFKANPNKPQSEEEIKHRHEKAVRKVMPDLLKLLNRTFGSSMLSKLTLVCIPSSKRMVTERRCKDFSENLCRETGMTNGYNYVSVISDGEAKHLGGSSSAQYSVDSSFFKDKNIILFDDVITSGHSMEIFRRELENIGANVICGFSIGKTKHERQAYNPIDEI